MNVQLGTLLTFQETSLSIGNSGTTLPQANAIAVGEQNGFVAAGGPHEMNRTQHEHKDIWTLLAAIHRILISVLPMSVSSFAVAFSRASRVHLCPFLCVHMCFSCAFDIQDLQREAASLNTALASIGASKESSTPVSTGSVQVCLVSDRQLCS
jgi:hypothetical protein